jgi:hypothetical protein
MSIVKTAPPTFLRGPEKDSWIALGFSAAVMQTFERYGCIYFISWSHNWKDLNVFWPGDLFLFDHDKMGLKPEWVPAKVAASIQGPYDVTQLAGQFVQFSPFGSDQEAAEHVQKWYAYEGPIKPYPLWMWRALRK